MSLCFQLQRGSAVNYNFHIWQLAFCVMGVQVPAASRKLGAVLMKQVHYKTSLSCRCPVVCREVATQATNSSLDEGDSSDSPAGGIDFRVRLLS